MFCPSCGTENRDELRFCRKCGHNLEGHRIALEGKLDSVKSNLKRGSELVSIGVILVAIFKLNILLNYLLGGDRTTLFIIALVGLLSAIPLVVLGLVRVSRAKKLLAAKDQPASIDDGGQIVKLPVELPGAPDTDRLISQPSATEHTTYELKE